MSQPPSKPTDHPSEYRTARRLDNTDPKVGVPIYLSPDELQQLGISPEDTTFRYRVENGQLTIEPIPTKSDTTKTPLLAEVNTTAD